MAHLHRLSLSGIRSFSDREEQHCSFYSPLTVILGHNGTGKTTIIEALKYAVTGSQPPNAKGGAFVHDPHVAGAPQVHAHVTLIFTNNRRERIMVDRKLMVSTKAAGGLTQKTLENILYKTDPANRDASGKNPAISVRCNDIDEHAPLEMGVSKAILENVIFCHQEDSNWPMAESSKLKIKFDEIFEATKWTKALASVTALYKERTVQAKVDAKELEGVQRDAETKGKLERKIRLLDSTLGQKEQQLAELEDDLSHRARENQKISEMAADAAKAVNELKLLEERLKLQKEQRTSLAIGLDKMNDSDDELRARLDGFQAYISQLANDHQAKLHAAAHTREQIDALDNERQAKFAEKGGLEARVRTYHETLARRHDAVRSRSRALGIRGYDATRLLSQADSQQFDTLLSSELKRRTEARAEALGAAQGSLSLADEELSRLQGQAREQEGAKAALLRTRGAQRSKLQDLERKVEELVLSETSERRVQAEVAGEEAKLIHAQRALAEGEYDQHRNEARQRGDRLQKEVEDLNGRLRAFNVSATLRAKLELKRSERSEKLTQAADVATVAAPRWSKLVGSGSLEAEDATQRLAGALSDSEDALRKALACDRENEEAIQAAQMDINMAQRTLDESQKKVSDWETREGTELAELENDVGEFRGDLQIAYDSLLHEQQVLEKRLAQSPQEMSRFFESMFVEVVQKRNPCKGCGRGVPHDELPQVESFVLAQKKIMDDRLERGYKMEQDDYEGIKADLRRVEALLVERTQVQHVRALLQDTKAAVLRYEKRRADVVADSRKSQEAVQRAEEVLDSLRSLRGTLNEYQARRRQAAQLEEEEAQVLRELENLGQSPDNAAELEKALQKATKDHREAADLVSRLELERSDAERAVTAAERRLNATKMLAMRQEEERRRREALQDQVDEGRRSLALTETQLSEMDAKLEQLRADLTPAQRRRQDARSELEQFEAHHAKLVDEVLAVQRELSAFDRELGAIQSQRNETKLEACDDALESLARSRDRLRTELAQLEEAASTVAQQRTEAGATERNLHDNLRYRETVAAIRSLEEEHARSDPQSRIDALKTLHTQYDELRREERERAGQAAHLRGEMASLTAQLQQSEQEMRDDYHDAKERHLAKMLEHQLNERANRDLDKLRKSIESGILEYHTAKMAEINENINYLWGKTYQGIDIEKIMIKAEADKSSSATRRMYNYRVTMVKNGAEMDMRGRCSAGQKVLASIIIRLALADSFSTDCSLLALDEPTTNLDIQNIEALARSLADLIKERRAQNNRSQLIIITHDEQFLARLTQSGVVDNYNVVERDLAGNSVIRVRRILQWQIISHLVVATNALPYTAKTGSVIIDAQFSPSSTPSPVRPFLPDVALSICSSRYCEPRYHPVGRMAQYYGSRTTRLGWQPMAPQ